MNLQDSLSPLQLQARLKILQLNSYAAYLFKI